MGGTTRRYGTTHTPGHVEARTVDWLLEGDPAIRWQTLRDLREAPAAAGRERRRVAREGWGARTLALQEPDGQWGGGIYTPKWTSTTYTMLLLRALGLPARHPAALKACELFLDRGLYQDDGINFWVRSYRHSEACVTGMVLSIAAFFEFDDSRLERLAGHLLARQMRDGGWNCRDRAGATHGSFHTTISALEALHDYGKFRPEQAARAREAQARGCEFLLAHRLFRSHRTGAVVNSALTRFAFPPRWHYDILRALDYFRESGAGRDPRLGEAIDIVRRRQGPEGRWILQNRYPGTTFFEMETVGQPSRWNTLRALRVLRWWESAC